MHTRFRIGLLLLALLLLALAATSAWWAPPLLAFVRLNSELIQSLDALLAIILALGGLVVAWLSWGRSTPPASAPPLPPVESRHVDTGGGDFVAGDQTKTVIGDVINAQVTLGKKKHR